MQQLRQQSVGRVRQGPLQSRAPSPRHPWAWAWVVVVVVVGVAPAETSKDMAELEAMVRSHTEALLKVERYLKYTHRFWQWYQANHRRLDELLAEGFQPNPLDSGAADDSQLQELYKRLDAMQGLEEQVSIFTRKLSTLEQQLERERQELADERRQLDQTVASLARSMDQVMANTSLLQEDINQVRNMSGVEMNMAALGDLSERVDEVQRNYDNLNVTIYDTIAEYVRRTRPLLQT